MVRSIVAENAKKIIEQKCLKQGAIAKKADYDGKVFSNMQNWQKNYYRFRCYKN